MVASAQNVPLPNLIHKLDPNSESSYSWLAFQSALYLSKWYRRPSELFDVPDDWLFAKDFHSPPQFSQTLAQTTSALVVYFVKK